MIRERGDGVIIWLELGRDEGRAESWLGKRGWEARGVADVNG